MNNSGKNVFIWVIIALVLVLVFNLFNQNQGQTRTSKVPYSEFLKLVDNDKVNDVSIVGRTISARKLKLNYFDFRICVEIPIKAKSKNLKFTSLPSKERKRIAGVKKVNAFKDGFLILLAILFFFIKKNEIK